MKKIIILLSALLLFGCVQSYQRYFEAIHIENHSSDILPIWNEILKEKGFSLLGTREKQEGMTTIANYDRYDSAIKKRVRVGLYLKDAYERKIETEILFTIGAEGWEEETKRLIDKEFEDIITKIKTRFGEKLKITKKSEPW